MNTNLNLDDFDEEKLMNYGNQKNKELDKELEDFINDDPELREMMSPNVNKKKKKKTINEDDLQLEDLESEKNESDKDLDDLLNEENPEFKRSISRQDSLLKSSAFSKTKSNNFEGKMSMNSQVGGMPTNKDNNTNTNGINLRSTLYLDEVKEEPDADHKSDKTSTKTIQVVNKDSDVKMDTNSELNSEYYDEKVEKYFHSVDNMKSIGVLKNELELMDHIIEFCKKKDIDYDVFDNKKFFIKNKMDTITAMIEYEEMDFEGYKASIKEELEFEELLLQRIDKDSFIKNKEFVKNRIKKRMTTINDELNQQPPEEAEVVEDIKKEENNEQPPKSVTTLKKSTLSSYSQNLKQSDIQEVENVKVEEIKLKPEVIKPKIKNQKLYDETKAKLEDYKLAVDYFMNIESMKQAEDAREKAQILNKAIEEMEAGKAVDELNLPIAITPDYICNMSKQERLNNFSVIIKDFSAKKNEENQRLEKAINGFKTIDKKSFLKRKDEISKVLDDIKGKVSKYSAIITKLTEMAKNPWIPAPLYVNKEEEEQVEKVNEEIPSGTMILNIRKLEHSNLGVHMEMLLQLSENRAITDRINKRETEADFKYSREIKLERSEYNHLFRKTIKLVLIAKKGCCFVKEVPVAECQVKLDNFKSSSLIEGDFPFKSLDSEEDCKGSKIFISAKIRSALANKEYITTSRTVLSVTRTFPPFKGDNVDGVIDEEAKPKNINKNVKVVKKEEVAAQSKKQQPENKSPKKMPELKVDFKMSDFSQEELENPDCLDNLVSIQVLLFKIKQVEDQIKKIEGRAPPHLRDKLLKMKVKKNTMEAQMGSQITIEDYLGVLRFALDHDQKLVKYFEGKKDLAKGKLVAERIPLLIAEIEEIIKYIKGNK